MSIDKLKEKILLMRNDDDAKVVKRFYQSLLGKSFRKFENITLGYSSNKIETYANLFRRYLDMAKILVEKLDELEEKVLSGGEDVFFPEDTEYVGIFEETDENGEKKKVARVKKIEKDFEWKKANRSQLKKSEKTNL